MLVIFLSASFKLSDKLGINFFNFINIFYVLINREHSYIFLNIYPIIVLNFDI